MMPNIPTPKAILHKVSTVEAFIRYPFTRKGWIYSLLARVAIARAMTLAQIIRSEPRTMIDVSTSPRLSVKKMMMPKRLPIAPPTKAMMQNVSTIEDFIRYPFAGGCVLHINSLTDKLHRAAGAVKRRILSIKLILLIFGSLRGRPS